MTAAEERRKILKEILRMSIHLFGNGVRKGCMDERLENIENFMNKVVTKKECEAVQKKSADDKGSKKIFYYFTFSQIVIITGLIITFFKG
jgi:hypothetical protein